MNAAEIQKRAFYIAEMISEVPVEERGILMLIVGQELNTRTQRDICYKILEFAYEHGVDDERLNKFYNERFKNES